MALSGFALIAAIAVNALLFWHFRHSLAAALRGPVVQVEQVFSSPGESRNVIVLRPAPASRPPLRLVA